MTVDGEAGALICVGINHLRSPVEVREKVVFSKEILGGALNTLKSYAYVNEAAIINTCNRVEVYADIHAAHGHHAVEEFFHQFHKLPLNFLKPHLYSYLGRNALLQLLRVTSSLDSQIIGEPQILGQVKDAYRSAREAGAIGPNLEKVFSRAFSTAKKVRTNTRIGKNAVSVNFAIVELCKQVFGQYQNLNCLLVGVGEMGSLCAQYFHKQGCRLTIVNRSLEKAQVLAQSLNAAAEPLGNLEALLPQADIVICSTSSTEYLVNAASLEKAISARRYRPMLCIDLGVPRNIDPAAQNIEQVYSYDIDDLGKIVADNMLARTSETVVAEKIIDIEIAAFEKQSLERRCSPIIENITAKSTLIVNDELAKLFGSVELNLSAAAQEKITAMCQRISNKIIHTPIIEIKKLQSCVKSPQQ